MPYGTQVLWPVHCVQGSAGAAFHPDLALDGVEMVIRKGFRKTIDSYSTFFENDRTTPTGLIGYPREHGLERIAMVGLAADFCVDYYAIHDRSHVSANPAILDRCAAQNRKTT